MKMALRTSGQGKTDGEFACSVWGSWHLAKDIHPERSGYYLAAYLWKGEPSERFFRGNLIPNTRKPVRGRAAGHFRVAVVLRLSSKAQHEC
jgi:hypothetical protein